MVVAHEVIIRGMPGKVHRFCSGSTGAFPDEK